MKTAAKVFIWIGMIFGCFTILPIIIGIFALQRINRATCKEDLLGWGIATLICCSTLGGIFMLCISEEELSSENSSSYKTENISKSQIKTDIKQDDIALLKGLKELLEAGVLTQEEFDEKKNQILYGVSADTERGTPVYHEKKVIKFEKKKDSLALALNIASVVSFALLIFFIGFAYVGDYYYRSDVGVVYYVMSVFGVSDIRFVFALLAIIFSGVMLVVSVISLFYKNKYFYIIKHILSIIAIALILVSAIFNITYRYPIAHPCTIFEMVIAFALLAFEIVVILRGIIKYFKRQNS